MESVIKNVWGSPLLFKKLSIVTIVYETGIYKAVVVSARASKCFFLFYILKWKDCLD